MVEHAVALGRAGFRVHPLKSKSQPYTKYTQTATSDEAGVRALWRRFPNALIAIATGDGLVVVDDDRRTGPDPSMPRTLRATTPKGGYHYYFKCATPLRNSASKLAEGIDVRGQGGYVVAPPSEGREWQFVDAPIAPMPAVLVAACLRHEAAARADFTPREHVPAGERHDYLVRFAGWLIANEITDDVEAETLEHALTVCEAWPPSEIPGVKRHIKQIVRWVTARESGG